MTLLTLLVTLLTLLVTLLTLLVTLLTLLTRFCEVTVTVTLHNCSQFTVKAFVEMLADLLER